MSIIILRLRRISATSLTFLDKIIIFCSILNAHFTRGKTQTKFEFIPRQNIIEKSKISFNIRQALKDIVLFFHIHKIKLSPI